MELKQLKVTVCLEVHVEHIFKYKNSFKITTNKGDFTGDQVILAAGGCASPNHGSDGSGYSLAKELGHKIIKPLPALVQLKSKENYFKTLAGVRTEAYIKLFVNDKLTAEEKGELLIANYGVSGIPIFQLSRFAAKALSERKVVELKIDFLPSLNWKDTFDLISERMRSNPKKTAEESLVGLFNNKLGFVMLKEAGIDAALNCEKIIKNNVTDLVNQIKEWKIPIYDTNSFEQAQVSAGGVDTTEITPSTMESKLVKGLYLTGELVETGGPTE
jgi:predicted Rossmann fold flavoprotein